MPKQASVAKRPSNTKVYDRTKRSRDETHHRECRDHACTGCAQGEVELVFTGADRPSAAQLYRFALEEHVKAGQEEQVVAVVHKLFERALEEFAQEDLVLAAAETETASVTDAKAPKQPSNELAEHRLLQADCHLTFAQHMKLKQQAVAAVELLKALANSGYARAWIHLGRAQLLLLTMALEKIATAEAQAGDSDSEDDDDDEEDETAHAEELNQLQQGLDAFDKGVQLTAADERLAEHLKADVVRIIAALNDLMGVMPAAHSYRLQRLGRVEDDASDATLHFERWMSANNTDQQQAVATLLYEHALQLSRQGDAKMPEAATLVGKAIGRLNATSEQLSNESPTDALAAAKVDELLGHAYLLKSTVEQDEDAVLADFDSAVEALLRAYQYDPDNEPLKEQLLALGIELKSEDTDEEDDGSS
ncbi:hypothetical protein THASP1DRAFT_21213 [Thamnocephalis sphaerospora]|uniref:Uncharacterized protein n=1 Tax=Thamnocephalis sphaerospora TaxID=78915 RepID=A0A4V1IXI6_9FUNG|nr:hypothetical protein THASP1DRAFT_21213 [Thamnocephalis sphaerospora]|eukprot:RKP11189.1 hypothetical protein THASP1DRAFT_21213 [Thamnocephalis sphaerospora]